MTVILSLLLVVWLSPPPFSTTVQLITYVPSTEKVAVVENPLPFPDTEVGAKLTPPTGPETLVQLKLKLSFPPLQLLVVLDDVIATVPLVKIVVVEPDAGVVNVIVCENTLFVAETKTNSKSKAFKKVKFFMTQGFD
jgi:hypothetical protein